MGAQTLVIGTRGSQLARWQADWAKSRLEQSHPDLAIEIRIITTRGDRVQDVSLPKLGEQGKGLFTKELEDEMLAGRIDIAVHSLKDLPTDMTPGLHIAAITEREDVRDALVAGPSMSSLARLKVGSRIGTSSLRRQAQIRAIRRDLLLEPIRGNVDTRLSKVDQGIFDAIILASAGLKRLGHEERITEYLEDDVMLPAIGQGALGVQTRIDDERVNMIAGALDHGTSRLACVAERSFLKALGGGCLVPIAAHAVVEGSSTLRIAGLVASVSGDEIIRGTISGSADRPEEIGSALANDLLSRGAGRVLAGTG
jgi:hydroxymethylbilane synthase